MPLLNIRGSFLWLFIICSNFFYWSNAQELPPFQNFTPIDYHAENQNWSISQSSQKLIYVANSKGLLEYDGASWELYPSPNETIMRSVKVVGDRIYTGCFMEFGYWTKNNLGSLDYTSLSTKMATDLVEDEEFWNIIGIDDYVIFQSLKRIYIFNIGTETVKTIESDSSIPKMYKVDESIYFQKMGEGIFKIDSGEEFLVVADDIIKTDEVIQIFGGEKNSLVLTKNNGFYSLQNGLLVRADKFPNELLSTISLYAGIRLKDNSFVLGSISNGLFYLNAQGELQYQIDQDRGLTNNTVLSLFEDIESNIWLGLDYGITFINSDSPYKVFNDTKGILGSVYASAIFEENLYLGTNQGLFYKKLNSQESFDFVRGTQGQVWCLEKIDDTLLCGHDSGTFGIVGGRASKISNIQGTWDLDRLDGRPELLLQGNYDGLYLSERSNSTWKLKNKISGFGNSSRYFETLSNKIFVSHEYNGVFELTVNDSFFEVKNVVIDTVIKGANSGIVKYNDDLLYAYKKGIFKYNDRDQGFLRDSVLSRMYTEEDYESGKLIVDKNDNKLWIFTKSAIRFLASEGLTNVPKVKSIPLTKEMRDGILGYETILKLNDTDSYLVGKTSGYIIVDLKRIKIDGFTVHIDHVSQGIPTKESVLLNRKLDGDFKSDENDLTFSFYAPEYNKLLKTNYQYRLKGIYDDWSDWSENAWVLYENLPSGEYTFDVRARIGDTISGNTGSYSFSIARQWYISTFMLVVYGLGVLLFSLFMHQVYKQYYRKQRQKLIYENQKELELNKVQNEKEIIRLKNDQLELENKSKSKELAVSTMSIIKKNEILTTIKKELDGIVDKRKLEPVINIIDKSLMEEDAWELFQEAFNNADSEFLKKIKTLHPKLSPNNLKLCAYLRLNLSSKEIARLLNISTRSVEIKRYRLRKKLNLKHEDNLVNYLLAL